MATKFGDSKVTREIRLYDVERPVLIRLTAEGVEMRVAGSRKSLVTSWDRIARKMDTPADLPSIYEGKPIQFLQHEARRVKQREEPND